MSASREVIQRVHDKLRRELGPLICGLLAEPDVTEILLNQDSKVWVERLGQPMTVIGTMPAAQAESLMATVASQIPTTMTRENPILECELPLGGERFSAVLPPVALSPCFSIRVPAKKVFPLESYVERRILREEHFAQIAQAVANRDNILVTGGTGSGKTTFLNGVLHLVSKLTPDHRMAILEDTRELQCEMENVLSLRTSDHVPMDRLLRHCLRQRPDRITVGEVRDGAALTLCKAWTTGHPGGASTVHSNVNDPKGALRRVEMLVAEAYQGPARELIAEAIDLIVLVARGKDGVRRVEGLARVANDLDAGQYRIDWNPAAWPEGMAA